MNKKLSAVASLLLPISLLIAIFAVVFLGTGTSASAEPEEEYATPPNLGKVREKERRELRKFFSQRSAPSDADETSDTKPQNNATSDKKEDFKSSNAKSSDKATGTNSSDTASSVEIADKSDKIDDDLDAIVEESDPSIISSAVELILLLDSSRSMTRTDPLRLRDQGAKILLNFLDKDDKIGIYTFDSEVKQILPLQSVSLLDMNLVEEQIKSIVPDGNFTDLELAVTSAIKDFPNSPPTGSRAVVLLSDGQMDPKPSRGTKDELTERLLDKTLPAYRKKHIKLYTIGFSSEADEQFLAEIAGRTKGLSWFASTVETLHLKFSDLLLMMKRPQLAEIENNRISVDAGIDEITFYMVHQEDETESVRLLDPAEDEIGNSSMPFGFRLFRGVRFDLITVKNPLVGTWRIEGIKNTKDSLATLTTDLQLQSSAPEGPFKRGDKPIITARFLQNGKMLLSSDDLLKNILFFSYKLVDANTGDVVAEGDLNDLGEEGDARSKDGIYSATVNLTKAGKLKCFVIAKAPTFSRQQILTFDVRDSLLQLSADDADDIDMFNVKLSDDAKKLSNPKVVLFVQKMPSQKVYPYPLEPSKTDKGLYQIAQDEIITSGGDFVIYAKVKGVKKVPKATEAKAGGKASKTAEKTMVNTVVEDISNIVTLTLANEQPTEIAVIEKSQEENDISNGEKGVIEQATKEDEGVSDGQIASSADTADAAITTSADENKDSTSQAQRTAPQSDDKQASKDNKDKSKDKDKQSAKSAALRTIDEADIPEQINIDLKIFSLAFFALSAIILIAAIPGIALYFFRASEDLGFFKPTFALDLDVLAEQFAITENMALQAPSKEVKEIEALLDKLKLVAQQESEPKQESPKATEEPAANDKVKDGAKEVEKKAEKKAEKTEKAEKAEKTENVEKADNKAPTPEVAAESATTTAAAEAPGASVTAETSTAAESAAAAPAEVAVENAPAESTAVAQGTESTEPAAAATTQEATTTAPTNATEENVDAPSMSSAYTVREETTTSIDSIVEESIDDEFNDAVASAIETLTEGMVMELADDTESKKSKKAKNKKEG